MTPDICIYHANCDDGFPSPSWEEWWEAICAECEARCAEMEEEHYREQTRQMEAREMEEHFQRHPHG